MLIQQNERKKEGIEKSIDVSVIIVNYNTKDLTIQAINSVIEKTEDVSYEIIVVDNASQDDSVEVLKNEFADKIILVESKENLGFGKGNNLGMQYANGENLFLLNPDTMLINNAIKDLHHFLKDNLNVAICGGNLYNKDLTPNHSFSLKLPHEQSKNAFLQAIATISKLFKRKRKDFNFTENPIEVGYITGADLMIRRDIALQLNGFDDEFFMYSEECELCFRAKKLDYKVYSVPWAKIIHLEGASSTKKSALKLSAYGDYLYFEKVLGHDAVKNRYRFKRRYFTWLGILTLGLYYIKFKSMRGIKKILKEEFIKWQHKSKEQSS